MNASADTLTKAMNRFANLGLKVYITEMDVGIPTAAASHAIENSHGALVYAEATVLVDGSSVGTLSATSDAWTDYTFPVTLAAGSHTIQVEMTNASSTTPGGFFLNRNLLVEGISLAL